MLKDRKCKCTHMKSEHTKWTRLCNECPCNTFTRAKRIKWADQSLLILCVIVIGSVVIVPIVIGVEIMNMSEEDLDIIITVGEDVDTIKEVMYVVLVAVSFMSFFTGIIYLGFVFDIVKAMKRKDYNS